MDQNLRHKQLIDYLLYFRHFLMVYFNIVVDQLVALVVPARERPACLCVVILFLRHLKVERRLPTVSASAVLCRICGNLIHAWIKISHNHTVSPWYQAGGGRYVKQFKEIQPVFGLVTKHDING
jgi:hypothetical protein